MWWRRAWFSLKGKGNLPGQRRELSYPTPPSAPTTRSIHATCVDAPLGARRIVVLGAARRRVLTCVRPLMRRVSCRGPGWESADQVQIKAAYSRYGVAHWFSRPRLLTVAPSLSCDPPTPDSLAVVTAPTPPQPELDTRHRAPAKPRRCGPSCWPAPPAPASGACGRACAPATSQPDPPCARPSGPPRWPR